MFAEAITHWTIRLALVCMAARFAGALLWRRHPAWEPYWRAIWTAGCVFFLLHVISAFHFYHHWSHADAFETTATRTYELLGIRFGEGIYFSYLFGIVWTIDVAWWWQSPETHRRRAVWLSMAVLCYMAFIAFNGAVIFEEGITRWVGVPVTAVLLLAASALMFKPNKAPSS